VPARAARSVSSWLGLPPEKPALKLVTMERAVTRRPSRLAIMTSGTIDIPKTSAPSWRASLISAGVSKEELGNTLVYTDHELPRMTRNGHF